MYSARYDHRVRVGTFWYAAKGQWTHEMPKALPAETGLIIRKQYGYCWLSTGAF